MVKPCISEPRALKIPALLALLLVTAGFCAVVAAGATEWLDEATLVGLRDWTGETGVMIELARVATWVGDFYPRMVLAVLLALWIGKRVKGYMMFALVASSLAVGYVTDDWLKPFFRRPRPEIIAHLSPAEGWSLPSGHAAGAVATFVLAAWLLADTIDKPHQARAMRIGGLLLALAIGASRVILGVHWPADVIAGWLVGACVAVMAVELSRLMDRRGATFM
jgi:undecaprenyl-diphosphatase